QIDQLRRQRLAHPIGARGQQLHHEDVAVAIDHNAGKAVAVAIEEAVAISVVGDYPATHREGGFEPPRDYLVERGCIAPPEHPHLDHRSGFDRSRLASLDRAGKNPGIATDRRRLAPRLESDLSDHAERASAPRLSTLAIWSRSRGLLQFRCAMGAALRTDRNIH